MIKDVIMHEIDSNFALNGFDPRAREGATELVDFVSRSKCVSIHAPVRAPPLMPKPLLSRRKAEGFREPNPWPRRVRPHKRLFGG
jgi:hypothetical protein